MVFVPIDLGHCFTQAGKHGVRYDRVGVLLRVAKYAPANLLSSLGSAISAVSRESFNQFPVWVLEEEFLPASVLTGWKWSYNKSGILAIRHCICVETGGLSILVTINE